MKNLFNTIILTFILLATISYACSWRTYGWMCDNCDAVSAIYASNVIFSQMPHKPGDVEITDPNECWKQPDDNNALEYYSECNYCPEGS